MKTSCEVHFNRFFNNKTRESEFKEFDIEKDSDNIDYIATSILLGIKSINIDDIIKNIIRVYYEAVWASFSCVEDIEEGKTKR